MSLIEGRWMIMAAATAAAVAVPVMLLDDDDEPVRVMPPSVPTRLSVAQPGSLSYALAAPPFDPDRQPGPATPAMAEAGQPVAPEAPPPQVPRLVGLVTRGGGGGVALVKGSTGETVTLRPGETVDGWRLVSLGKDEAVFEIGGSRRTAALDFSNKLPPAAGVLSSGTGAETPAAPVDDQTEAKTRNSL